jgi:hypothetical protein
MNEEELHALLRAADAQALRAAEKAIDIEKALVSAKEAELNMLLCAVDAEALRVTRETIDVEKELIAAKAAAASQLVTDQASGEAPPATVFRSLIRIMEVSGAISVTTSEARRRSRKKMILRICALSTFVAVIISGWVLRQIMDVQIDVRFAITVASALCGAAFGLLAMGLVHSWRLYRTMERSAWRMAGQVARTYCDETLWAGGRIVTLALPEWSVRQHDSDTDKRDAQRDLTDSLESTSER